MRLLANLRQNGRESLTKLSRRTRIPVSTLYNKIKDYDKGLIRKHTVLVDFAALGFKTKATILLKLHKDQKDDFALQILKEKSVNSCYKINNGYDFLLEGVFKEMKDVEDFVEKLEDKFDVKNKIIYYIIEEIRKEEFMSSPDYLNLTFDEAIV